MGKFLFTLIFIFTIPFAFCAETGSSDSDNIYLQKEKNINTKYPRDFGKMHYGLKCVIYDTNIYFEIPNECEYLEVQILQDGVVCICDIVTPDEPVVYFNGFFGEINIICKTDAGDTYRGYIFR